MPFRQPAETTVSVGFLFFMYNNDDINMLNEDDRLDLLKQIQKEPHTLCFENLSGFKAFPLWKKLLSRRPEGRRIVWHTNPTTLQVYLHSENLNVEAVSFRKKQKNFIKGDGNKGLGEIQKWFAGFPDRPLVYLRSGNDHIFRLYNFGGWSYNSPMDLNYAKFIIRNKFWLHGKKYLSYNRRQILQEGVNHRESINTYKNSNAFAGFCLLTSELDRKSIFKNPDKYWNIIELYSSQT